MLNTPTKSERQPKSRCFYRHYRVSCKRNTSVARTQEYWWGTGFVLRSQQWRLRCGRANLHLQETIICQRFDRSHHFWCKFQLSKHPTVCLCAVLRRFLTWNVLVLQRHKYECRSRRGKCWKRWGCYCVFSWALKGLLENTYRYGWYNWLLETSRC